MRQYLKNNFLIGAIILLAAVLLSIDINKKFVGHHDWNSVVYSNVGRNYLRYGLLTTKLGQVRNHDSVSPYEFNYMTHYPPLLSLLVALSFKLFGISELSARLVPVFASLGMILLIYQIGKEIGGRDVGFIAAFIASTTPLFIYFGKLPVHETVVPVFSLFSLWSFIKLIQTKKMLYCLFIVMGIILGGLVNWTGYYIVIPFIIYAVFNKLEPCFRFFIYLLFPLCIGMFLMHLWHLKILTGSFLGGGLASIFFMRVNPYQTASFYGFSLLRYVMQEIQYFRIYFTNIVCVLFLIWICKTCYAFLRKNLDLSDWIIFMLLIYGSIHLIVFQNLVFIHDYMIYYLLPFVSLSAAYIIKLLVSKIPSLYIAKLTLLCCLVLIALERRDYTKALLETQHSQKGYDISQIIKIYTLSGEKAYISSSSFKEFFEVFIGYYSDRKVWYGEDITPQETLNYDIIIRPKEHDPLPFETKKHLDKTYQRYENQQFIWYKINR